MALPISTPAAHDAVASRKGDTVDCIDATARKPEATS